MTYTQLREAVATILEQETSAFVSNGVDLLDVAINNAKNWAQSRYDFEYARTVVSVSVDPTTGGDLASALEVGTNRSVRVKKIERAYLSYTGNMNRPVRFIGKKGQAADAERRYEGLPYAPAHASPLSASTGNGEAVYPPMIVQQGGSIFLYPNSTALFSGAAATVYLDVVEWLPDFAQLSNAVAADGSEGNGTYTYLSGIYNLKAFYLNIPGNYVLWYDSDNGRWLVTVLSDLGDTSPTNYYELETTSESPAGAYTGVGAMTGTMNITVSAAITVSSFLLTYGSEFLMWKAIVEGNYLFEQFVFRQEGALPPPEKQADAAFRALLDWDAGIVATNTQEFDLN